MKKNKTLLVSVLFLLISIAGVAQVVIPPPPTPPPGLPIDNGIVALVILGVAYGVYKIITSRKASNV
ncbi:PID-CTERM protein-sorting domain-containing protein [Olleya sp. R77988]|uniref:PID-CTERM protein-sorting domain-containing protein n=1 Tax=Olleya sp. R77988 TaxID=3093875 RepID=UPI0037CA0A90